MLCLERSCQLTAKVNKIDFYLRQVKPKMDMTVSSQQTVFFFENGTKTGMFNVFTLNMFFVDAAFA